MVSVIFGLESETVTILVAALSVVSALGVAALAAWAAVRDSAQKKRVAEIEIEQSERARQVDSKAAETAARVDGNDRLINQLQEQLTASYEREMLSTATQDRLQQQVGALRIEVTEFEIGVRVLTNQLVRADMTPEWAPRVSSL